MPKTRGRKISTPAIKKTRAQWKAEITALHGRVRKQTVEGIFEIGCKLIAAKRALDHGEFEKMIECELPFSASTAQRLMRISRDSRLRKAAHVQLLPAAWGTLYELTKLSDEEIADAVASGAINPKMKRNVLTVSVTHKTERIEVPYTRGSQVHSGWPAPVESRPARIPVYPDEPAADEPEAGDARLIPFPAATNRAKVEARAEEIKRNVIATLQQPVERLRALLDRVLAEVADLPLELRQAIEEALR